ncbi:hypothetical protein NEOLEDRAFT_1132587 [Neolentinus lepideus HHB14362 ss-1]|uniref:UspA domain-containing protein n=1 Tax=Neolentinus lepideus HHB14362 ss-1 TaxID=1314782 RepID=A0A165T2W6_9AGAM|nr:hypothetical protein NEOLEDRAFT_1132587 [Neolentinus lepideus HHB14362 ss-1]
MSESRQGSPLPHPSHITLPAPVPLRSAMKHNSAGSRPSTPGSPAQIGAVLPRTSTHTSISGLSTVSNSPSPSPYQSHAHASPIPYHIQNNSLSAMPSPSPSSLPLPSSPLLSPSPSTPMPIAGYTPKVSFDTFEDPSSSMFSYTLRVKSDGFEKGKGTRVFLCASSPDQSGLQALDWACESLVQEGDELIVLRGVGEEELQKPHGFVRDSAHELIRYLQEKCIESDPDRKLSLIVEFVAGKITTTIDRLIALYRPDALVVGTRGQRGLVSWGVSGLIGVGGSGSGVGSVSKYCLSHSPVPIIVVRPESKVRKAVEKRRADPKRGRHFDGLPGLSPATTRQ